MSVIIPPIIDPVLTPGPLLLKNASVMLKHPYLGFEAGYVTKLNLE
jgi:hypothetical protein